MRAVKSILMGGIYFHYYLDFRGRLYADSPVAYTHNRLFRYFYYYGEYSQNEIDHYTSAISDEFLKKFTTIETKTTLKSQYSKINYKNKIALYYIIIIFFELGKIFKKDYVTKNAGKLSFDDIIEIGITYFNTPNFNSFNLYAIIEYNSLILMLDDLQNSKYYKYPIFKDATASGLQILAVLLGGKTNDTYIKTNLIDKNIWYDTYHHIIEKFIAETGVVDELLPYFNRSTLKRTIMTYNYNATLITCWAYFKEDACLP